MRRYRPRHLARKIRRYFTPTRAWALALSFVIVTSGVSLAETIDATDALNDILELAGGSGPDQINVLANDIVVAGGALTIVEVSGDFVGQVAIAEGGAYLTYEPALDFCGPDSFAYVISDGLGGTDAATVNVEVTCPDETGVVEETTTTTAPAEEATTTTGAVEEATTTTSVEETTTTTAVEETTTTTAVEATTTTTAPAELDLSTAANLIVKLVAGLSLEEQADVITSHGGVETSGIPVLRLHMVAVAPDAVDEAIAAFASDPAVVSVDVDLPRAAEAVPNDPGYADQWAFPLIGWEEVYGVVTPAGSSTLAILDTGVDARTPDLAGRVVGGWSFDGADPSSDASGHGTGVATIAAASVDDGTGIAGVGYAGVSIMPVRVLGDDGTGQDSDIITGLVWAVDHGADVVVMAFSNPGESAALQYAVNYAWSNGVVLVAAAGNDGGSAPTYPAGLAKVVGVGATDSSDTVWSGSNRSDAVFMVAPGVDIASSTGTMTGTSASAAMVAGAAVLMQAYDPSASPAVIVGRLARNTDAATGRSGNGRLNLARSISDVSTNGVTPAGAPGGGPIVGPYVAAANNFNVTPLTQSVSAGSTNNYSWTFTATNAGNEQTTTFTIPSGWTAPSTAAGPGQVTVVAGTCAASLQGVSGMVITIRQSPPGPSTGTCGNSTNFTLNYNQATAPTPVSPPQTYTFNNQHGQDPQVAVTAPVSRSTSTVVDCDSPVAIDEASTCSVTVTDTDSGSKSDPSGSVDFSSSNPGGSFDSLSCTLVSDGVAGTFTSSCSVEYTGDVAQTDTITATYNEASSALHASSADTDLVVVTLRDTTTSVDCSPDSVAINQGTVCVVQVDDVDSGTKSNPAGTVEFSSDQTGNFSSSSCTLAPVVSDPDSSSCQVGYRPTADAGTHTITGDYQGSVLHEESSDDFALTVTERSTSTVVDCDSPVAIDEASTCSVTVTDTDSGSKSDPSGSVDFSSSNPGGSFDSLSCTLVSDGVAGTFTSSCSVEYTGDVAQTDTITATYNEASSALHASSADTDLVVVTLRDTTTSVDCSPDSVAIDEASECTVTVTDVDGGTSVGPQR